MSLQPNQWDEYRRRDGTINLLSAFIDMHLDDITTDEEIDMAKAYFRDIELLQRINSRQAAAVAVASLRALIRMERLRP